VWLVALPWMCVFVACGTGGSTQVSSTPASARSSTIVEDVATHDASAVTMADYESVQTGDTHLDVVAKLGPRYEELSNVEIAGVTTVMLSWANTSPLGSNCSVTLQNGRVVAKAQFGLPAGSAAETSSLSPRPVQAGSKSPS